MSDSDSSVLLARLQRLEDSEAARNHQHAYAAALDAPIASQVAALWTLEGVLSIPSGDLEGRGAIEEFYRSRIETDPSEKRHFITSPRVRHLEPGLVEVAAYFIFTARGDTRSALGWGTYLDRVRITAGEALFEHKTIELHLATDLDTGWPELSD